MARQLVKMLMVAPLTIGLLLAATTPTRPARPSGHDVSSLRSAKLSSSGKAAAGAYGPPRRLAELQDPAIDESSGIVGSRRTPGLYWTHNDSGDGPFLYAFDVYGKSLGVWRVTGAQARDWEDIAIGPGRIAARPYLYVGDRWAGFAGHE